MTLLEKASMDRPKMNVLRMAEGECPHHHYENIRKPEYCFTGREYGAGYPCAMCWCREWQEKYGEFRRFFNG